jgi:hypothetical protein
MVGLVDEFCGLRKAVRGEHSLDHLNAVAMRG